MRRFVFIIIGVTLVLAAAGFWYWQRNPYSKEILKLEILGPTETDISQEIEYTLKYKNNGNVRLEEPRLIFEFPEYAITASGGPRRQEIGPEDLGDIYPGQEKVLIFKGRLLGKEGEIKTAKASISYRPKNLKARYESNTTFTTALKAIPLTFEFDLPSKVEAGRDFKFTLNYFSNLDYPLSNMGVRIEYPSDFEFVKSTPQSLGKNEWDIPLLNKAEGGRVEVQGKLLGELRDQKIFRASLGVWIDNELILLKEITRGVEIMKPNLYVFQRINGQDQYTASPGEVLHYEIFFRNLGDEPFVDLFLVAKLEGLALDMNSIKTNDGQVNKSENSVMWDWRDVSQLKFLEQGEEGKVDFWVNLKGEWPLQGPQDKNPVIKNNVLISRAKEEFRTRVNSKLFISQKGYFEDEAFGNTGPVPPKVGQPTTYTIFWQVKNYYNDVGNVKVKAFLPPNVNLTGKIFPESESSKFSFDSASREIVWNVSDGGGLAAGTGVSNTPPNIAFQVSLTPGQDLVGKTALIIDTARILGTDQWTDAVLEKSSPAVDTTLPDDTNVQDHTGLVGQ